MAEANADDLFCQTIAVHEALDQVSAGLGVGPAPITLAAVKFAARTTAHIDVSEEQFLEGCRAAFRAVRAEMSRQPDISRTCPPGFLQSLIRAGGAKEVTRARRPRLRLIKNG